MEGYIDQNLRSYVGFAAFGAFRRFPKSVPRVVFFRYRVTTSANLPYLQVFF